MIDPLAIYQDLHYSNLEKFEMCSLSLTYLDAGL
jgi:hypothetical protein